MPRLRPRLALGLAASALAALAACVGEGATSPDPVALAFDDDAAMVGPGVEASVVLRNAGAHRFGPLVLTVDPVRDDGGVAATGVSIVVDPPVVATLAPGASARITLSLHGAEWLGPGRFHSRLSARLDAVAVAAVEVEVSGPAGPETPVAALELEAPPGLRRGDVVRLGLAAADSAGAPVSTVGTRWSVEPADGGWITPDGRLVAYRTGPLTITARAGTATASATVDVTARDVAMDFRLVGEGLDTRRFTSDLWVHGTHAWTGSWGLRAGDAGEFPGNQLRTWRLGAGDPVAVDSLLVDARTTNDVKVSADGALAVVTHEGSNDGLNGVTLLDLSDPDRPTVTARLVGHGLQSGVHNAWIDGRWLYLVVDGVGSGLRVFDVADPANPRLVSSYWAGESFLHDVLVRDGLAFLSHWDAGLVILDVGGGPAGGSPQAPVELGRLRELGGQTHNAWYWPDRGLVFVGEEDFSTPGRMHVVDVSEPRAPRKVAEFAVPGGTPHNFWLDEAAEVLYLAWYDQGVRALDVSGELLGEIHRQGREMGRWTHPAEAPRCWAGLGSCTWAPQLHEGRLYLSDVNRGLVVLEPVVR